MADPIRVLILEDRRADAELMVAELRRAGFQPEWDLVDTEADFVAALVHPPEIVLADYAMPHWDGLKALRVLRERELDIPAIIVTGALGDEKAAECIRMGAADFLLKDRLGRLGQAVSQAVGQKRLRRERRQMGAALRASEAEYRALVDNVNDAIVVNVGEMRVFVNRAYLELIGLEDETQAVGVPIDKHVLPDDRELVIQRSLAQQGGEVAPTVYEYRVQRTNGEVRRVQASSVATVCEGQRATLAILRDMTLALQEKEIREGLQIRLGELVERGEQNFAELVRALAREHRMLFGTEDASASGKQLSIARLPPELQKPLSSVDEFKDALLRILRRAQL